MAEAPGTLSLEHYASDARAWIAAGQSLADECGHREVDPLHLLVRGIERDLGIASVLQNAGADPTRLLGAAKAELVRLAESKEPSYLSASMLALLRRAERDAQATGAVVGVEHLLTALMREVKGSTADVLGALGLGPGSLANHIGALRSGGRAAPQELAVVRSEWTSDLIARAHAGQLDPVIGRGYEILRLLTILERREKCHPLLVGEPGVGKRAIVRGLAAKIAQGDVPTSLAGVRLLELDVGALTAGTRLRSEAELRMRKLIDGAARGEERLILLISSITRVLGAGPSAPAFGDLLGSAMGHNQLRVLATTSPEGWNKILSQEPALARFFTQVTVDEPSRDEATAIVRGLASRYEEHHQVRINEAAIAATVHLAKRYVPDRFLPDSALDLLDETAAARRVESDGLTHKLDAARTELVSLEAQRDSLLGVTDQRSTEKRQEIEARIVELEPEVQAQSSAIAARRGAVAAVRHLSLESSVAHQELESAKKRGDFARVGELEHGTLPELAARLAKAEGEARSAGLDPEPAIVDEANVASTLAEWTRIPVAKMLEAEAEKLLKMEQRLARRVVGQEDAVRAIALAVRRGRVGLRDPKRPIGSFLFLGTSGVGKTELAKALAEFLFDDEQALTRLDMSEFMERHMAQRLLGAPPGYADSDQGGFLTEAVRRRPYSVLLFDEVEKAHEDVFNLLLQVLDDGRLTDGRGRLADFTNTVVILTSNIGSDRIMEASPNVFEDQDGRDALRDVLLDRLREFFRPEFLNRIGEIVVFRPLSKQDLLQIVDIQLDGVRRLLSRRGLQLVVDDAAKRQLVELGYEPALGARPLQRTIVRHLQDPLAERLLNGTVNEGDTVVVGFDAGQFSFGTAP
jgi:ATP-dependent Clp protease ATP-binding subunit ClpB